jgi:hypothetical protein
MQVQILQLGVHHLFGEQNPVYRKTQLKLGKIKSQEVGGGAKIKSNKKRSYLP